MRDGKSDVVVGNGELHRWGSWQVEMLMRVKFRARLHWRIDNVGGHEGHQNNLGHRTVICGDFDSERMIGIKGTERKPLRQVLLGCGKVWGIRG